MDKITNIYDNLESDYRMSFDKRKAKHGRIIALLYAFVMKIQDILDISKMVIYGALGWVIRDAQKNTKENAQENVQENTITIPVVVCSLVLVPWFLFLVLHFITRCFCPEKATKGDIEDGHKGEDNNNDGGRGGAPDEIVTHRQQQKPGQTRDTTSTSQSTSFTYTEGGSGHDSQKSCSGPADDRPKGDNKDGPKGKDHDSEDDDDDDNNGGGAGESVVLPKEPTATGDSHGEHALRRRKPRDAAEPGKVNPGAPAGQPVRENEEQYQLTGARVWNLALAIGTIAAYMDLGHALEREDNVLQAILTNKQNDVTLASQQMLTTWKSSIENEREQWRLLAAALRKANLADRIPKIKK